MLDPREKLSNSGWTHINSWNTYSTIFTIHTPPSPTENYKVAREHFYNLATSGKYAKVTKELNFETVEGRRGTRQQVSLPSQISNWIKQIQSSKMIDGKNLKTASTTVITQADAQKLVSQWRALVSLIKTQQWGGLNTELSRLEIMINNLNAQIQAGSTIDLGQAIQTRNASSMYSVISALEGLLSRIQGAVLEQEAIKFINERIPSGVFLTGNITVGGEQIKPDLVAALSQNMQIKNADGKVVYIFKNGQICGADGVPMTKTVNLTEYELQSLIEQSAGISAKTTSGQITFHQGYNIEKLINDAIAKGGNKAVLMQMIHMYQLGISPGKTGASAYQRYAVSKLAIDIIGENNIYMVTKDSIIPTYQYVDRLLKTGLRFSNNAIPTRGENTDLIVNFGNTNIIGPKA